MHVPILLTTAGISTQDDVLYSIFLGVQHRLLRSSSQEKKMDGRYITLLSQCSISNFNSIDFVDIFYITFRILYIK